MNIDPKYYKYGFYVVAIIAIFAILGSCMRWCSRAPQYYLPVQQPAPVQQVVVQPDNSTLVGAGGVIAGMAIGHMMSNGQRYNGHNGYGDRSYSGPSRYEVAKQNLTSTAKPVTPPPAPTAGRVSPITGLKTVTPTAMSKPSYSAPRVSSTPSFSSRSLGVAHLNLLVEGNNH